MENDLFVKPIYRSSSLINYPQCPKKYDLSTKYDMERSDSMRDGLIMEGLTFGFKHKEGEESEKKLIGRKNVDLMRRKAQQLNDIFQFDGKSYVTYEIEFDEFIVRGELDFVGDYTLNGERKSGILDLKYTKSIERLWNYRNSKAEFFQSAFYPMLRFLHKHKDPSLLMEFEPEIFVYVVVENNNWEDVFYNTYSLMIDAESVMWAWNQLVTVHQAREIGYPADESNDLCLGFGAYGSKCSYLQHCTEGKSLILVQPQGGHYEFSSLNTR